MRRAEARFTASIMINSSMRLLVGRGAGGLDEEDVPAPDVIADFHPDFTVAEGR